MGWGRSGDGYSREIQIPALKGFVVGDIVPSDTNLLIHYRRDDQVDDGYAMDKAR